MSALLRVWYPAQKILNERILHFARELVARGVLAARFAQSASVLSYLAIKIADSPLF